MNPLDIKIPKLRYKKFKRLNATTSHRVCSITHQRTYAPKHLVHTCAPYTRLTRPHASRFLSFFLS